MCKVSFKLSKSFITDCHLQRYPQLTVTDFYLPAAYSSILNSNSSCKKSKMQTIHY